MVNIQDWINQKYPKEERRWIKEIYLNEANLEGELDLGEFTNYLLGRVLIPQFLNETKLIFKNKPDRVEVIKLINAQEWLEQNYPKDGICTREEWDYENKKWENHPDFGKKRNEISELNISNRENLEGNLNLNDFVNMKKLNCIFNKLTSLDLSNCEKLEKIDCHSNLLTTIILSVNPTNLKKLYLGDNNFPEQDLTFLSPYINLEKLNLSDNKFIGSLDCLSNMRQLKKLWINDNDLNELNIDKLPKSLDYIEYYVSRELDCKLTGIISELEKHFGKFGHCLKCLQPNTSYKWCYPCAKKEWLEDIKSLTGQELVKNFIEKQGKNYWDENKLQWIPYKQFSNIEFLDEGGFSKVYKAKWGKQKNGSDRIIILKILNNSQNITLEFLTEIANNNLALTGVVLCLGISQDPITRNYTMVMEYMNEGNLRQWLQTNHGKWIYNYYYGEDEPKLGLENKLRTLKSIVTGLDNIHNQNLVHRDLHSGNILNDDSGEINITDFGLSYPANHQKKEGQIFGVIPYIAPEVLQGQPYTKASDIYSFGIVAYELLANSYPYYDYYRKGWDDEELRKEIENKGLRPDVDKITIPQLLKDLIKSCWDIDPKKRPSIKELDVIISSWCKDYGISEDTLFCQQYETIEKECENFSQNTPYQIYPSAITTSRPIDTKEIAELFQKSEKQATEAEIKKIEREINQPLTDELKDLVKDFIQVRKNMIKNENYKEAKIEAEKLEDRLLEEKSLSEAEENIEKIIAYCKRLTIEQEQLQANIKVHPK